MPPFIVFNAQDFLDEVAKVKKFWLHTKLNRLRIETNRSESTISLYSIHKQSGLETAVTIPAYMSVDCIINLGTVKSFYNAVEELQKLNVGPGHCIRLHLVPSCSNRKHFFLTVLNQALNLQGHIPKSKRCQTAPFFIFYAYRLLTYSMYRFHHGWF